MNIEIGNTFKLKGKNYSYTVFDIVGAAKGLPSETKTIYLKLLGRTSWFENAQFIISCPERSLFEVFEETVIR
jgi:hypothetical protein